MSGFCRALPGPPAANFDEPQRTRGEWRGIPRFALVPWSGRPLAAWAAVPPCARRARFGRDARACLRRSTRVGPNSHRRLRCAAPMLGQRTNAPPCTSRRARSSDGRGGRASRTRPSTGSGRTAAECAGAARAVSRDREFRDDVRSSCSLPSHPRRRNAPASGLRSDRRDCASSAGASPTDRTATGGTPRFRNLEEPPRGGPHGVAGGERAWRDDPPTETSLARGAPGVAEPRSRHAEAPRPFPKAGTRRRLPSGPGAGPRGARGRAVRRSRATPSIRRCERGEAGSARAGPRRSPLAVMHAALPEGGPATRPSPGWRAASPRPAWGGRS